MKRSLLTLLIAPLCLAASHGSPILVGGFDGESPTALQSPSITNVDVTLASSHGPIPEGFSQISSTLWGTQALDVVPTDDNSPAWQAVIQEGTLSSWTLTLVVTNNQAQDLSLDSLHFIVKKDIANQGPQNFTVAYTAGDLGTPATTLVSLPNGITPFDVSLGSFLGDTTLSNGESATFTWTPGAPQDPGGNTAIRIDNFALSGTVVPEPSTLALIGLAGLGLLRRVMR